MDPDIMKKMEYSWKEKQLSQVFGTNGKALLINDNYKVLVDMEIPIMTIDVDGFSKDTYEKIRVGGNFDKIIKTVETVYDYIRSTGSKTRLELIYLSVPDFNEHEVVSFVNWCEENEYEYKITSLHTWAENRSELSTSERNPARTSPCRGLWGGLMIYWNGDVSTCFQDADGFEIFGNVKEQSIQEIWQTSLRQRRQEHVKGTFRNLCHGCQSFLNSGLPKCNSIVYPEILR